MANGVRRFARDVGFSLASLGVSAAIHFILRTFLARYLGATDLGLYTLCFTVYSFFMLVSVLALNAALTRYVAQFKEDVTRTHLLVSSGVVTTGMIGLFTGLALFALSNSIARIFDMPELGGLLRIIALALPFITLQKAVLGFLRGMRRMPLFAFINICQSALTIVLTVALVLLGYGVSGAVVALVLPIILVSLFSLFSIRKTLVKPATQQYLAAAKMLLVFGAYAALGNSIDMVRTYTDSVMIGYFMNATEVGYYAVAVMLSQAISLAPSAVQTVTTPMISTYHGRGEIDRIDNLINRIMKYTAIFLIPICFMAGFLGREIIWLFFGKSFILVTLPLQILLIGSVCDGIFNSVGATLSSTGHPDILFKLSGTSALVNVVLNILLIPRLGITGAAIATSTSMVVGVLLHLYFTQRLIGVRIHWGWFAKLFAFTALLAAATYGLGLVVNHYLAICLGIIGLIAVLLTRFITKEDIHLMRRILH